MLQTSKETDSDDSGSPQLTFTMVPSIWGACQYWLSVVPMLAGFWNVGVLGAYIWSLAILGSVEPVLGLCLADLEPILGACPMLGHPEPSQQFGRLKLMQQKMEQKQHSEAENGAPQANNLQCFAVSSDAACVSRFIALAPSYVWVGFVSMQHARKDLEALWIQAWIWYIRFWITVLGGLGPGGMTWDIPTSESLSVPWGPAALGRAACPKSLGDPCWSMLIHKSNNPCSEGLQPKFWNKENSSAFLTILRYPGATFVAGWGVPGQGGFQWLLRTVGPIPTLSEPLTEPLTSPPGLFSTCFNRQERIWKCVKYSNL